MHTANVIASALEHKQSSVVLAATKFFLGYDVKDDDMDSDEDEDVKVEKSQLDTNDVKNVNLFGSRRALKKKRKRLDRAKSSLLKLAKKEMANVNEAFTAVQLLQDPQRTAEKLFHRVKSGKDRFESKLAMIQLISRIIGIHKLMMLNFYPFLQKYLITRQQDVMVIMASLVQACHELVPPDALSLVLRHLVNTFVDDKARPEVITIGLKTVREICVRIPMVMSEDLLSDLVMYRGFRDKEVASAARGLISLFREVAPKMLQRKFRGKGANLEARPPGYGEVKVMDRIAGADLLEDAIRNEDSEESADMSSEAISSVDGDLSDGDSLHDPVDSEVADLPDRSDSEACDNDVSGLEESDIQDESLDDELCLEPTNDSKSSQGKNTEVNTVAGQKRMREADPESMRSLKKRIASVATCKAKNDEDGDEADTTSVVDPQSIPLPIEMSRLLDDDDFAKMRLLRRKHLVDEAMKRHGLVSQHKQHKLEEIAEADAHETLRMTSGRSQLGEERVEPGSLMGKRRGKPSKLERVSSILKGREGNDFKSASKLKKKKTGGTSNKEKMRRMDLPLAARMRQAKNRIKRTKLKRNPKNFKGHFGKGKGGVRKK